MKLSLTLHNKTYSVESDEAFDHTNVYDLAEQFKGLLVNAGFHPSNVDSIFNLDYQWFTDEENQGNMQGHDVFGRGHDKNDPLKPFDESEEVRDVEAETRMQKRIEQFQKNMYKNT
jgi:Tat protein secretion system quality control protein TatD with DNase activity